MTLDPTLGKASILWVTGDEDVMRFVYQNHNFGYWSAAFDTLLEKHGFLDFEKATQHILDQPEVLRKYDMLIISWLPARFWKPSYVRSLRAYDGLMFLEGPFPRFVEGFLGIEKIPGRLPIREGRLVFQQAELKGYVERQFQRTLNGKTEGIDLTPKQVLTKASELARQELHSHLGNESGERIRNIVLSYLLAYKNRFEKQGYFFTNPGYDALAALAWVRILQKIGPGSFEKRFRDFAKQMLEKCQPPDSIAKDADSLIASAIWGVVYSEAAKLFGAHAFADKLDIIHGQLSQVRATIQNQSPLVKTWFAYLMASSAGTSVASQEGPAVNTFIKSLPNDGKSIPPILLWLLASLGEELRDRDTETYERIRQSVSRSATQLLPAVAERLPKEVVNWRPWELLLLAAIHQKLNSSETAKHLFGVCLDQCFDEEKGSFHNAKVANGQLKIESGYLSMPWIVLALMEGVQEFEIEDGAEEAIKAYQPEQIAAWANTPYWIEPYANVSGLDEAVFQADFGECTGLFRRGRVMGSTFQVLSYLSHFHTMQPLKEALLDCPSKHELVLETLLFLLLQNHLRSYGRSCLKVQPWPWGKKYCLTIRHDVDRIPTVEQFQRLLSFEQRLDLGVSWFWIPGRLQRDYIRRLEQARHEMGLHAMKLVGKGAEILQIEEALTAQRNVSGEAWHGGGGGDYWIGHPSVGKAVSEKLLYTEFMPTIYDFPYSGFPAFDGQGCIFREPIVGITHTVSTDLGPRKGHVTYRLEWVQELADNGYYCLLLNHPDVNFEQLQEWITQLPEEGRLDWNCHQVASWWRATHQKDHLQIEKLKDTPQELVYQLTAQESIDDLELRLFYAPQAVSTVQIVIDEQAVDAQWEATDDEDSAGIRVRVSLPAKVAVQVIVQRKRLPRYEEVFNQVPSGVRGPNVEPNYHLPRVTNMVEVINRFTPYRDLRQEAVVADVGCGYGPFTIALHVAEQPQASVGLDLMPRYMQIAKNLAEDLDLDTISFAESDMVATADHVQAADIVIVNNSINFLTTPRLYRQAIDSFYRALRPGGALVILTPNRLFYREAFTQLVGVQFMPKPLANWYVHHRKKRDTYADIRLPSPFELRRWSRQKGFKNIEIIDAYTRLAEGWKRYFKPRFYMVALKGGIQ